MKFFTCFAFVLIVSCVLENVKAITDEEKSVLENKLIAMGLECAMSYPLTLAHLKEFQSKKMPEGSNPKCFTACMFKKVGLMDDKGMISSTGAHEYAEQVFKGDEEKLKNIDEIMKICSAVNEESTSDGNKGCDRAKLVFPCLMENAPKYGFNFDY